jgi:hypothetical protein
MENNNNNITASTVLTEENKDEFIKYTLEKVKELIKYVDKEEQQIEQK